MDGREDGPSQDDGHRAREPASTSEGGLAARSALGGGAAGTCANVHPGDVSSIADGKSVRLAVNTKDGSDMELIWKFEHGSWRVAGGDLIEPSPVADYDESRPAPASKKTKPATKAGARTNAKGGK